MAVSLTKRVGMAFRVLTSGKKGWTGDVERIIKMFGRSKPDGYTLSGATANAGKVAIIAACLGIWIREYTQARFAIKDNDDNTIYDHPALAILKHPGKRSEEEWLTERELKRQIMAYKLFTGTAYLDLLTPANSRNPVAIDIYHAGQVEHVRTKTHRLAGYKVHTGNGNVEARDVTQMIRLPWDVPDPEDTLRGLSPLQSCFTDAQSYIEVGQFVNEFLKNGAFPGLLLINKEGWASEDQRQANKKEFIDTFGAGKRGSVGVMDGDLTVATFAHGLKDLDLSGLRDTPEAAICTAFNVPVELTGAKLGVENSAYATKHEARKYFTQGMLASTWMSDAQVISTHLMPLLGYPQDEIVFDTSSVPLMKEDTDARVKRALEIYKADGLSRDELRAEGGWDAVDKTALYYSQIVAPKAEPIKKGTKAIGDDSEEEQGLVAQWKAANDELDELAGGYSKTFAKAIRKLRDQVMSETGAKGFKRDLSAISDANLKKLFLDGTSESRSELAKEIVRRAASAVDFDPDDIRSWLEDAVKETIEESASKINISMGTIKEEITKILKDAGRTSPGELAEKLGDYFDILGGSRLASISVTTATAARSRGQNESWGAINQRRSDRKWIKKRWLSQRDGDVRDTHAAADGQTIEVTELFEVGTDRMKGPGLGSQAKENIGCRCVEVPQTVTKEKS